VTWPDGIALAVGLTTAALLTIHRRTARSTTQHHQPRSENHHGRDDHAHQQPC
jgi:hypothetical protein